MKVMRFINRAKAKKLQLQNHVNLKIYDKRRLEQDWRNNVIIAHPYMKFKGDFSEVLSDFKIMWDGHLSRVNIAKHRTKLFPADAK